MKSGDARLQRLHHKASAPRASMSVPVSVSSSVIIDAHRARISTVLALSMALVVTSTAPSAWAFEVDGANAFTSRGCVGCHAVGGNVVVPSATLFTKDLERNGLATKDDIANLIALGKGKMPGYGVACAPKGACTFGPRLEAEEIDALASFVFERAGKDWK